MQQADAFRERLDNAIKAAGYTRTELADELDVGLDTVSNWVRDGVYGTLKTLPSGKSLLGLSLILDVDYHWLLTGEGDPHQHKRMEVLRRATTAELEGLKAMLAATEGLSGQEETPPRVTEGLEGREVGPDRDRPDDEDEDVRDAG